MDQDGSDFCAGAARQQNGLKTELIQDMSHREQHKNWCWLWKAWVKSPTVGFSFWKQKYNSEDAIMALLRSVFQLSHWDPFHLLQHLSMTLYFMVYIKERCTLTKGLCTKDHYTGSYTLFYLSVTIYGN